MNDYDDHIPEEFDDALGGQIAQALAPLRPDPDEFQAEVERRVEDDGPAQVRQLPVFVQRAVAFLPPLLLPQELWKAGTVAGGIAAKKAGWKFLPGVLALPAITFVMVLASFVIGLRAVTIGRGQVHDSKDAKYAVADWWRRNALAALVIFAALLYFGRTRPMEAVLVFVGLSMVSLVGIFGALARAGFASRKEVGHRSGAFLTALVFYGVMFLDGAKSISAGQSLKLGVPLVISIGAVTCFLLANDLSTSEGRRRTFGPVLGCLAVLTAMSLLFLSIGEARADRADAKAWVESGFGQREQYEWDWADLAGAVVHLNADGGTPPDLEPYRASLANHLDRVRAAEGPKGVNPFMVRELEVLGLFRDVDYDASHNEYFEERGLAKDTPFTTLRNAAFNIRVFGHEHDYTDEEIERLCARLLAGLDRGPRHGVLEDLMAVTELFDYLGRPERTVELAPMVEAALLATWAGRPGARTACFAPGPTLIERDEDGVPNEGRLTFVWMGATDMAIRLMARYGVPEGVDLAALHAYLDEQSYYHRGSGPGGNEAVAVAAASHLVTLPEWSRVELQLEHRPLLQRLSDHRLLLASLLLAVFCIVVTLRAPRVASAPA